MSWILAAIFGATGGTWSRGYAEEGWLRNPPWCLACIAVLGAVAAIVIDIAVRPQLGELGFFERALLAFGSGVAGVTIIGGGIDAIRGKGGPANR